jgi:hypothetical protein
VWEITGAEFSKSDIHTASGISIRFPRFTKLRDDKSVQQATDLPQLLVNIKVANSKLLLKYFRLHSTFPYHRVLEPCKFEFAKTHTAVCIP